jgi:hypothetical protein
MPQMPAPMSMGVYPGYGAALPQQFNSNGDQLFIPFKGLKLKQEEPESYDKAM